MNKDWGQIAFSVSAMILKTLAAGAASMAAGAVMTKLLPAPSIQEAWNGTGGEPAQIPDNTTMNEEA